MQNLFLVTLLVMLVLQGCILDEFDRKLVLCNHSNEIVYFRAYVDTLLTMEYVTYLPRAPYAKIAPKDSGYAHFAWKGEDWAHKINTVCKDSLLRLFVFNADTARIYGWINVLKYKKYTRYDLSVKELDRLHWHVIYTGFQKIIKE